MLKTLLESLLSLFVKKSETSWVSSQTFPIDPRTNISPSAEGTYIAPSDGYFGVYAQATASRFDLYARGDFNITVRCCLPDFASGTIGLISNVIPVAKGQTVAWNFQGTPEEIWFCATRGSA